MNKTYYLWVDIEATRLPFENSEPVTTKILEISLIITNTDLKEKFSYHFVLNEQDLDLSEFSHQVHSQNGLIREVGISTSTPSIIDEIISKELNLLNGKILLAGSTLSADRELLRRHLPKIYNQLHYQSLDVASIRLMIESIDKQKHSKINKLLKKQFGEISHRSQKDLLRTIEEYRYYLKIIKGYI